MPRRNIKLNGPDPIDVKIGQRLREVRTLLGISQTDMANMIDVTFQQLQKYEKGRNRITASKLVRLSDKTHIPITAFFEKSGPMGTGEHRDVQELLKAYTQINSAKARLSVRQVARTFSEQGL
jgi:transcriptional regulator with XRE-family HTH domain